MVEAQPGIAVRIVGGEVDVVPDARWPLTSGEVRIDVISSAINGADARLVREASEQPLRSGLEFCGIVSELSPDVASLALGDTVMGIGEGAHASQLVVDARLCFPVPVGLDTVAAGGFCEGFTTAHDALVVTASLLAGETVLINGAAGGVGIAGIQVAQRHGARVVASVWDPARRRAIAELFPDVKAVAPDEAHSRPGSVDVVLELVGSPNFPGNVDVLADDGRIVVISRAAGSMIELDLGRLMAKRGSILARTLKTRSVPRKAAAVSAMLADMAGDDEPPPRVIVDSRYAMQDAPVAFDRFIRGGKLGKVILVNGASRPG